MPSTTRHVAKEYIECAIQTDTVLPNATFNEPTMASSDMVPHSQLHLIDADDAPMTSSSSLPGHSRTSTQTDSAYTQGQTDLSFESTCSSADQSMTTTTRAYKMNHIPASRPPLLLNRQPSSRVVSLPEATPKFHMKTILTKKTARVVSMPLPAIRDVSSDGTNTSGDLEISSVSEGEEQNRNRVRSHATDVPHTPSTPSSPDSVVIIANNSNQLSTDFLRQRVDEESPPESDDDDGTGWVTWAPSPPRPIPALHGPLSLPYARCPSGAEGTIIEEPESLSRVIWGLDSDDLTTRPPLKPSKAQSIQHNRPSSTGAISISRVLPQTPATNSNINIPSAQGRTSQVPRSTSTGRPFQVRQHATSIRPTPRQALPQPPDFVLRHSEPIDLVRLIGDPPDAPYQDALPEYNSWPSFQHDLPTPELVHDVSPELQAMLFAKEHFKHNWMSPTSLTPNVNFAGHSNALVSSTSLLDTLKSSRSPIILEELTSQYPHSFSQTPTLEYTQQRPLHHSFLPTPPSSASPVWSSAFSPPHGSLLSPDLLAAGLSQLHFNNLPPQTVPPRLESSHRLLRSAPNVLGNSGVLSRKASQNALGPAAYIGSTIVQKLPPRLAAEYARRYTPAPVDGFQLRNNPSQHDTSPVRDLTCSPSVPKAPPNTPHGTASPYGPNRLDIAQQPPLVSPPSPTSPRNTQSLGFPQAMRSVPLNRLVQRRLSTVVEEDGVPNAENGATVSVPIRSNSGSASGLHLFLSSSGQRNTTSGGQLNDPLRTRYGIDDMGVAEKARNIAPGVKLPGAVRGSGPPTDHSSAPFVKEASRRQGSNNTNNDGSRRGDGIRSRGQKRGGRGRKGKGSILGMHGTERVDGGMVVKS